MLQTVLQDIGRVQKDLDSRFKKIEMDISQHGRLNVQKRKAFGLVDFTSEDTSNETRFIIVTNSLPNLLDMINYEDYVGIEQLVYIYILDRGQVQDEIRLNQTIPIL